MSTGLIHRAHLAALCVFTLAVSPVWPQSLAPDELRSHTQPYVAAPSLTLRTQVQLVEVPVIVRDKHHKPVEGLRQSDFTVFDSGKAQEITSFSVETFNPDGTPAPANQPVSPTTPATVAKPAKAQTPPRYVALCFDDLSTEADPLLHAKAAAKQFVKTELAPGDQVGVITTAFPGNAEFTNNVDAILTQIDKVHPGTRGQEDSTLSCPSIQPYEAYLIANNLDRSILDAKIAEYNTCARNPPRPRDTVVAMSNRIWERVKANSRDTLRVIDMAVNTLAKAQGRRMILLTSSGFLSGNLESEEEMLINKALRAGVVINALNPRGLYAIIPGGDASTSAPQGRSARTMIAENRVQSVGENARDDGLAELASGTGGAFYHNNNDLLRGFREVGMVPEVMYVLGFSPPEDTSTRFRPLKVHINSGSGYTVQTRKGYTPAKPTPAQDAATKIDAQMSSTDVQNDLPVRITWEPDPQKGIEALVVHLDLNRFQFDKRDDRRVKQLTFIAVLRDAEGKQVAGNRSDLELNLTDASFKMLLAGGEFNIGLNVHAPPGKYTARGLVLDGGAGKMVTSSQQVELPDK